jgi:hypothetical protein
LPRTIRVWDATTFTNNRERLQKGDVFQKFMTKLSGQDKAYDTADHVAKLRAVNVTAHVAKSNSVTKPASIGKAPSTAARPGTAAMPCRRAAGR